VTPLLLLLLLLLLLPPVECSPMSQDDGSYAGFDPETFTSHV
jgi:hypothetical protein